ncbi:MAG: hypothetical protein ACFBSF_22550 [Leptolyngbyaceae cyanobacterium]
MESFLLYQCIFGKVESNTIQSNIAQQFFDTHYSLELAFDIKKNRSIMDPGQFENLG